MASHKARVSAIKGEEALTDSAVPPTILPPESLQMRAIEFPSEPNLPFSEIPELPNLPFSWIPKQSALRRLNALYRARRSPLPSLLRDLASAASPGSLLFGIGSPLGPRHSLPLDPPVLPLDPPSALAGLWAGALCQGRGFLLSIRHPNSTFTTSLYSLVIILSSLLGCRSLLYFPIPHLL